MIAESSAPTIRRSRARKIGLVALWFVIGVFVLRAGLDWWAGHRLAQEVTRLEARYGTIKPVNLASVPDRENRARAIRAAVYLMNDAVNVINSQRSTAIYRAKPSTPVPSNLRALVRQNESATRIAEDARERPASNWSYERDQDVPPLLAVRTLSNLLYLKACVELEDGHADEAARALAAGVGVAASLRNEQVLIVQLIRIAVAEQQDVGVQRLLDQAEPSAAALADLSASLEENRAPAPAQIGLIGELRQGHRRWSALADADAHALEPSQYMSLGLPEFGRPSLWLGLAAWFSRPVVTFMHTRFLRETDQLIEAQAVRPSSRVLPSATTGRGWLSRVDLSLSGLERAIQSGDEHVAKQAAAEIAIALRRYRLARGAYPADLSALAPDYLKTLPIDPYTGKPTSYSRSAAGFELKAGLPTLPGYDHRPFAWSVPR